MVISSLLQMQTEAKRNPALAGLLKGILEPYLEDHPALNQGNVAWVTATTDALIEDQGDNLANVIGGYCFVVETFNDDEHAGLSRIPAENFDVAERIHSDWALCVVVTNNSGGNVWLVHKDTFKDHANVPLAIRMKGMASLPAGLIA